MLFTLILAQAVLYSNSLVSACRSLGPDGCRKAPGAGQSEARGTGRPLCTLSAGGSQPNGNLSMIQPQPHMKPNSLSARTINKDKPHSADHPGSLYCYWAAPNCSLNTPPLGVFTHIYIEALTTEMWNGVQCLFQVVLLHKNIIYAFLYSAYVTIHIITAQWWEDALLLWSTTLMFPRENTCEFLFTLQYIILVLHRLKSKGGIQLPTAPEAYTPVMHFPFFFFFSQSWAVRVLQLANGDVPPWANLFRRA